MARGAVMTVEQFDQIMMLVFLWSRLWQRSMGRAWPFTEFAFSHHRLRPDVAVLLGDGWKQWDMNTVPVGLIPDIAVEVISPNGSATHVERKTRIYLEHGVAAVWCIYLEDRRIYVQTPSSIRMLKEDATLSTPLLRDWSVTLRDLFPIQ